jgi:hypothetical protein
LFCSKQVTIRFLFTLFLAQSPIQPWLGHGLGFEAHPGQELDHPFEFEHDPGEEGLYSKAHSPPVTAATQTVTLFGFSEFAFYLIAFFQAGLVLDSAARFQNYSGQSFVFAN